MLNRSEDKTIDLTLKNDEFTIQPSTSETVNVSSEINESTQTVLSLLSTPELQATRPILSLLCTPELQGKL